MSNDWKTGEGSWVTTPDGVTISQHMIAMAVEFVNRHTDAMPPMLVHEIKKHLAAQAQMVTRICEMSARPTPDNGLREALEDVFREFITGTLQLRNAEKPNTAGYWAYENQQIAANELWRRVSAQHNTGERDDG